MADWKEYFCKFSWTRCGYATCGGKISRWGDRWRLWAGCRRAVKAFFFGEMRCFRQRDIATAIWWDLARQRCACDWYLAQLAYFRIVCWFCLFPGFFVTLAPFFLQLWRRSLQGPEAMRESPPECLSDPMLGRHLYVKINVSCQEIYIESLSRNV
jgi:hypothetical protein